MDIEDWYHLDYFDKSKCKRDYSMLDGINRYCELLDEHNIPSSFFVLGGHCIIIKRYSKND